MAFNGMVTRRGFTLGGAGALAAAALPSRAQAQAEPIRLGWLTTLTGPLSSPGIGFDRGVRYAAEEINAAGGVKGRMIEVVTRDTQGDPTKAVNAAQEMISRVKAHVVFGPTNSGAYGQIWAGDAHTTGTLEGYGSLTGVTAIFSWNNPTQQFQFWFRGFPTNFQTLTPGLERGKYYFFQTPGGVTVSMN